MLQPLQKEPTGPKSTGFSLLLTTDTSVMIILGEYKTQNELFHRRWLKDQTFSQSFADTAMVIS